MRNSKRTRKTKIGSSAALLLLACLGLGAAEKNTGPHALVAGTVYRPPGFALPGASVHVTPEDRKLKVIKVQTDSRGEFAVRVPSVPAQWSVHVQMSGYQPQTKSVSIAGEERHDLSFVLDPAAKGERK